MNNPGVRGHPRAPRGYPTLCSPVHRPFTCPCSFQRSPSAPSVQLEINTQTRTAYGQSCMRFTYNIHTVSPQSANYFKFYWRIGTNLSTERWCLVSFLGVLFLIKSSLWYVGYFFVWLFSFCSLFIGSQGGGRLGCLLLFIKFLLGRFWSLLWPRCWSTFMCTTSAHGARIWHTHTKKKTTNLRNNPFLKRDASLAAFEFFSWNQGLAFPWTHTIAFAP